MATHSLQPVVNARKEQTTIRCLGTPETYREHLPHQHGAADFLINAPSPLDK